MSRILPKSSYDVRELSTKRLTEGEISTCTGCCTAELPPPNTKRWVARRKAAVVIAVRSGTISLEEARRRYEISKEEFLAWERAIESRGVRGLLITGFRPNKAPLNNRQSPQY